MKGSTMTNEVTPLATVAEQFQEKLKDKMREHMGELLPDAVLSEMMKRCFEDIFFKDREYLVNSGGYRTETVRKPSFFCEAVIAIYKERANELVTEFVESKRAEIDERVRKFLSDQNLMVIVTQMIMVEVQNSYGMEMARLNQSVQELRAALGR